MALAIQQNLTSIMTRVVTLFGATGGTEPYVFSVESGGAGGSIGSTTGIYTAPSDISTDPTESYDTIKVVDNNLDEITATINICSPLGIICDIIRDGMSLDNDQVHIYNQKYTLPNDSRIYVSVGFLSEKVFASTNREEEVDEVYSEIQTINMKSMLNIDIASRSMDAYFRKEEAMMALTSNYSKRQQEANSIRIFSVPGQLNDISGIDGAAIPYRYNFLSSIQYAKTKVKSITYYDTFNDVSIEMNK